jgi:hypothetical protein
MPVELKSAQFNHKYRHIQFYPVVFYAVWPVAFKLRCISGIRHVFLTRPDWSDMSSTHFMAQDPIRIQELTRMKRLATGLLILVAIISIREDDVYRGTRTPWSVMMPPRDL